MSVRIDELLMLIDPDAHRAPDAPDAHRACVIGELLMLGGLLAYVIGELLTLIDQ